MSEINQAFQEKKLVYFITVLVEALFPIDKMIQLSIEVKGEKLEF